MTSTRSGCDIVSAMIRKITAGAVVPWRRLRDLQGVGVDVAGGGRNVQRPTGYQTAALQVDVVGAGEAVDQGAFAHCALPI
jgi:hypothetical protein|tara:strand:+ start:91 stop:333 length:243 start_codon:yes stop_codon:yes gene_type:complete